MAIIYSYPIATPESQDLLVGTEMAVEGGEDTPRTRTFTIGSISSLISEPLTAAINLKANITSPTFLGAPSLPTGTIGFTQAAGNSTTALATTSFVTTADNLKANIASPTFTGVVTSPSFVKVGGAPTQYLMANGTTSTTPTLQQVVTAGAITDKIVTFSNQVNFGGAGIDTSISCATSDATGLQIDMHETGGTALLITRIDAPTATPFKYVYDDGDTVSTLALLNTAGDFRAKSFIKTGGGATEYLMADGNARIHTVTNSTQATAFTVAALNSTYPTATIGFTVQCTNGAVLKSYQKTSTGWISYTIANVA